MLTITNSLILGWGLYLIFTAKSVGESRAKKNTTKGKKPVTAAFEFEVTPVAKKRGRPVGSKNKKATTAGKANSPATKKTSR